MKTSAALFLIALLSAAVSCSSPAAERGIADRRTDFKSFLPMQSNPERDGLKPVKPFFQRANQSEIIAAIEKACAGGRTGSSVYDERTGVGYYVNCNAKNRQLLNGYVPLNPKQEPRSR